jgi:hypothetical protein
MSTETIKTSTTHNEVTIDFSLVSYSKILVLHDTSQMSDRALSHAAYIARMTGSESSFFMYSNMQKTSLQALFSR